MKKVNALWIKRESDLITYNHFEDMFNEHNFIGFLEHGRKYMLIKTGNCKGFAVNPLRTFTDVDDQKVTSGQYFIFDTANELFEWLKD